MFLASIVLFVGLILGYASTLHNIDLSWNAKHLNLTDDNGFIEQDVLSMYQRSILTLWIYPLLFVINFMIMYYTLKEE